MYWLIQILLLAAAITSSCSYIIVAPSIFVVGNEETILVINDGKHILDGTVNLLDNPHVYEDRHYDEQHVRLQAGEFKLIKFQLHPTFTPHIDVVAKFNNNPPKTRTFKVSQRSGHIFLQTDKPIYNPKEKIVNIRFIATDEDLLPANRTYRLQIKNPEQRLTLSKDFYDAAKSMFSYRFTLPEEPALGEWSVAVSYGEEFRQKQETTFHLEEYVLPTFTVQVNIDAETLLPEMATAEVTIVAKHVYGKPVKGQVMLKEFLKAAMGDPEQQQSSGNWKPLDDDGTARFTIDLTSYQNGGAWRPLVHGKRLLIEAVVMENNTGKQQTGSTDRAVFDRTWYKISIGQMQQEIRPGFPALITIRARHANGRTAVGVPVALTVLDDYEKKVTNIPNRLTRTDDTGLASFLVPTEKSYLQIRVIVEVGDLKRSSTVSVVLRAYKGREYISLQKIAPSKIFTAGEPLSVEVKFQPEAVFSGGLIALIAAGKIVDVKPLRIPDSKMAVFTTTAEMSPKARVVAIAWKSNGQTFIDSFFVRIKQHCRHADFKLEQNIYPKPGGHGDIEFSEAEKDTVIGLMAVDEAVYGVRNSSSLSRSTIFSKLENSDRGCGDGGGSDLEESAASAGIILVGDGVNISDNKNCQVNIHKRRSRRAAVIRQYGESADPIKDKCCKLALSKYLVFKTCEERSDSLINEFRVNPQIKQRCQRSFLKCCQKAEVFVDEPIEARSFFSIVLLQTAFPGAPDSQSINGDPQPTFRRFGEGDPVEDEVIPEDKVRQDFRESFLFEEVHINESSKANKVRLTLPHSITTWSIQSVSVNPKGGICAQPPVQVMIEKQFFIQLEMPYKVIRNEHVQIRVLLYNYAPYKISGNLYIYGVEGVCTQARPGERSDKVGFHIEANSIWKVDFPVFPLKEGYFPIKVEAISSIDSDAVQKDLYVVPEGREVRHSYSIALDPTNTQKRKARSVNCGPSCRSQIDPLAKNQTITIETSVPEDVVEGTPQVTLAVIGEKIGPAVHTALYDVENMLTLPKGCGEQNMMRLAPLVYMTEYLKGVNKLERPIETKAKEHIMMAYSRQINFQKNDGSFSAFRNRRSSLWLTAFVAKVFCRATKFFKDPATFATSSSRAVEWLVKNQHDQGYFMEVKPILHKSLLGGVKGKLALTAFTTAALDECDRYVPDNLRRNYTRSVLKAKNYLMKNLETTTDGYTAAILAYALGNTNTSAMAIKHMRSMMIMDQEQNTLTIKVDDDAPWVIEGNAYALLAATKAQRTDIASSLVDWLITKQTTSGGFQSTQDTVVALQALSEFLASNPQPIIDLSLKVSDSGNHFEKILRVARESATVLQTMSTNDLAEKIHVQATGRGSGLLSVLYKYNTLIPPEERCSFNITVSSKLVDVPIKSATTTRRPTPEEEMMERQLEELLKRNSRRRREAEISASASVFRLNVCAYLLASVPSAMSIVQVDMITGYYPYRDDLVALEENKTIDRFELLPDRVNLYVDEFEPKRNTCFSFRVIQSFAVNNAQPAAVAVYDYYNKNGNCPTFYELATVKKVLVECTGASDKMCKCLQNTCPPKDPFDYKTKGDLSIARSGKDAAKKLICKRDYAIEGYVISSKSEQRTFFYKVNVTAAWREKTPMIGQILTFTLKKYCTALLVEGLSYMLFGKETLAHQDENGSIVRSYNLNEDSLIFRAKSSFDENIKGNFDIILGESIDCSKYVQ